MRDVNRIMQQALINSGLAGAFRSPSYRSYSREGSKDKYFYTTQKCKHKGKLRWVAGVYRHLKSKDQWKLVKRVGFARRFKADAWALAARDKGL